jgi:hypothetical protein
MTCARAWSTSMAPKSLKILRAESFEFGKKWPLTHADMRND